MNIVQIMLGKGLGGIEQALVDHCEALRLRGHEVTAIVHPGAAIRPVVERLGLACTALFNLGEWDWLAALRLRAKLRDIAPDVVVCHGNRAFGLARKAGAKKLVAAAHNYNTRRYASADGVFAITTDLLRHMAEHGVAEQKMYLIPNMVRCHELPRHAPRGEPPVIAAMGRFVKKKGFDVFIEALAILRDKGQRFRAVIGGGGEEETALRKLAHARGLEGVVSFPGWIDDKKAFYSHADIFCLPSLHEPFGIVLLEAFMYGVPVVTTDAEGPRDIVAPNYDALVAPKGDADALAESLAELLNNPSRGEELAANGFAKVKTRYTIESVGERMEKALVAIIQ